MPNSIFLPSTTVGLWQNPMDIMSCYTPLNYASSIPTEILLAIAFSLHILLHWVILHAHIWMCKSSRDAEVTATSITAILPQQKQFPSQILCLLDWEHFGVSFTDTTFCKQTNKQTNSSFLPEANLPPLSSFFSSSLQTLFAPLTALHSSSISVRVVL